MVVLLCASIQESSSVAAAVKASVRGWFSCRSGARHVQCVQSGVDFDPPRSVERISHGKAVHSCPLFWSPVLARACVMTLHAPAYDRARRLRLRDCRGTFLSVQLYGFEPAT